ncbi:MAG: SAVED domain-containing protein [Bacteroidetes bacterium]|nr:SAVED domain-containing protein [Bacteroidota bacterium]
MNKKNKRLPIPKNVRDQVWIEAAGRCQFRGCNEPLWYNGLTMNKSNFSKMAHIIGASEDGPRGNENSEKLAQDPSNIMITCGPHHDEIDDGILQKLYPADELKAMKQEHISRVRMLLDLKAKKTRPLILTSEIKGQHTMFSERSIKNAILPQYYPDKISESWFKIEVGRFDRQNDFEWKAAFRKIESSVDDINRAIVNTLIEHISIFGLAPQPLLMYLGRQIGDKITAQVYEPRRTDDSDKKWAWDQEVGTRIIYKSEKVVEGKDKNVILLVALSDYLGLDKYNGMVEGEPHIYQLSMDKPVQGFLKRNSDKSAFIQACRSLLNQIQNEICKDCIIHVLPAMPASLAVEFGRLIQPTKDPKICVYENVDDTKPIKVVDLN